MTTTLYLIAQLNWYVFKVFEGDQQIAECLSIMAHIEKNFGVEATCISIKGDIVIQDNVAYILPNS